MRRSTGSRWVFWGFAAVCMVSFLLPGCGKKEEKQVPQPDMPAPPAATEAAAPPPAPRPVVAPVVGALQLMPEQAAIALAAPSLDVFYGQAIALTKRVAPKGADIEGAITQKSQIMAVQLGVPTASTPVDVMKACGIDTNAPVAVFLELDSMYQVFGDFAIQMRAATSASESPAGTTMPPAPVKPPQPGLAFVFTASDPVRADAFVTKFIAAASEVPSDIKTEQDGDITVKFYKTDGPAYFVSGSTFVCSNTRALLQAVAVRMKDPADVRYGTTACPINDPAEIATLVRMDKLLSIVPVLSMAAAMVQPQAAEAAKTQMKAMNDVFKAYDGPDPMVVTWNVKQNGIDLLARIDTQTHPALPPMLGDAAPLTLMPLCPSAMELFMDMRLTPEAKAQLERTWKASLSAQVQGDPRAKQTLSLLRLVLALTGEELAVGVTGQQDGLPLVLALVEQADAEKTKSVITEIGVPSKPLETYNEVELFEVPVPMTPPIRYAFIGNTLAISNDLAALKGAIDRKTAPPQQTYFTGLQPPLDGTIPRYMVAVLHGTLFNNVLAPMALRDQQEASTNAAAALSTAGEKLREMRLLQERRGSWLDQSLSIRLN